MRRKSGRKLKEKKILKQNNKQIYDTQILCAFCDDVLQPTIILLYDTNEPNQTKTNKSETKTPQLFSVPSKKKKKAHNNQAKLKQKKKKTERKKKNKNNKQRPKQIYVNDNNYLN